MTKTKVKKTKVIKTKKSKEAERIDRLGELVQRFVDNGEWRRAATLLAQKHPVDVAKVLEKIGKEDRTKVFKFLPLELQAEVLLWFDEDIIDEMLKTLSHKDLGELVGELDVDDAVDLVSELPEEERNKVLSFISPKERKDVEKLLEYPENSAGGLMTTRFITFPAEVKVSEVTEKLKKLGESESRLIYIVDKEGKLKGATTYRKLLLANPNTSLGELAEEIPSVHPLMDQEDIVRIVEKYDLVEVPVVNEEGKPIGVITLDDIMDIVEEEASEDIYKLGGLGEVESIFSNPFRSAKRRLPWLVINLLTAFIAASVVGLFKDTISSVVYLAVFMPVIAGMGGNAGTQTLAMVVRSIALGEVSFKDVKKLLLKEVLVGVIIGITVGAITSAVAYVWVGNPFFGLLVFIALLGNMIVACIMGLLIPIILKALGQDPALASGVIVTTFTDVTGYLLFLGLATLAIKYLT